MASWVLQSSIHCLAWTSFLMVVPYFGMGGPMCKFLLLASKFRGSPEFPERGAQGPALLGDPQSEK
jgi:hypothetical protein